MYILQPVLGGHPVLSSHLSIPKGDLLIQVWLYLPYCYLFTAIYWFTVLFPLSLEGKLSSQSKEWNQMVIYPNYNHLQIIYT